MADPTVGVTHSLDKALYSFDITVPRGYEVVSNGFLTSRETKRGWTTWDAREPMASYLARIDIGFWDVPQVVYLLGGIVVIVVGADLLVGGAATAARSLGVSDAIVGLTIVAIGTSAPEFVTTVLSTLRGDRDIALGNLLGSSVYNLALIVGLTILFAPTVVEVPSEVLEGDLVLMAAGAIASVPLFLSGRRINRVEGGLFVAAYCVYLARLLVVRA